MTKKKKKISVAVAMSGGVDSSVVAALCVEKYGQDNVFGVTMKLFCYGEAEAGEKSCCSVEAINDAKKVCDQLGIAHYVIDAEKEFKKSVIQNFLKEYENGRTPNPCVRCNQLIKFDYLLKKVRGLGADFLATGHYARIREITNYKLQITNKSQNQRYQLLKGKDAKKDQSYFLYNLNQDQLAHVMFPIGEIQKKKTRIIAETYKLVTAQKTESQEICFVVEGSVSDYLRPKISFTKGKIVDKEENILGEHEGLPFYTVGQRKGLGGGFKNPMYVTGLDIKNNQIIVGEEQDLYRSELTVNKAHWISGVTPKLPLKCSAMIRYNMKPEKCIVSREGARVRVTFQKPLRSISSGQSIVLYKKDVCLGGGIIE